MAQPDSMLSLLNDDEDDGVNTMLQPFISCFLSLYLVNSFQAAPSEHTFLALYNCPAEVLDVIVGHGAALCSAGRVVTAHCALQAGSTDASEYQAIFQASLGNGGAQPTAAGQRVAPQNNGKLLMLNMTMLCVACALRTTCQISR